MKYLNTAIHTAVAITVAMLSTAAVATPGKLNSSGCHNSKKAGYHCHRAQTAKKPASAIAPTGAASTPKKKQS